MKKDSKIDNLVRDVATNNNVADKDVEMVVDLSYDFVNNTISAINFKEMSVEEFRNTKKNFNMPGLFKLHTLEGKFVKMNKLDEDEKY
jgi:hypothetical protein